MNAPGPRWVISYRLAGDDEDQALIIQTLSMTTALKAAQQRLRALDKPVTITGCTALPFTPCPTCGAAYADAATLAHHVAAAAAKRSAETPQ